MQLVYFQTILLILLQDCKNDKQRTALFENIFCELLDIRMWSPLQERAIKHHCELIEAVIRSRNIKRHSSLGKWLKDHASGSGGSFHSCIEHGFRATTTHNNCCVIQ